MITGILRQTGLIASIFLHLLALAQHSHAYEVVTKLGHGGCVTSVAFSPDGTRALSGSYDQTIKLWDVATGALLRTFSGHENAVKSVAFSPDGRHVLSGSSDHTVKLWDTVTGALLQIARVHNSL